METKQPNTDMPRQILTILAVQDLRASVNFYSQLLGWKPTIEAPVFVELTGPSDQKIGLYERESYAVNTGQLPDPPRAGQAGPTEIYFQCEDLEARIEQAQELGARELSPLADRPWGDEVAYFADPDENVIALSRPKP